MKNFFSSPVAHRGLHGEGIPENSLAAFRAACEAGYPVETDVRFSKDGRLVVFHDDSLARMTGIERNVCDCTLSELERFELGGTKETIPSIEALLETVAGRVPLLIEIKNVPGVKGKRIAAALSDAMKDYEGAYAVQSFQPAYAKAYKKRCPEIPCGLLSSAKLDLGAFAPPFARLKRRIVSRMSLNFYVKPDFVSFEFSAVPRRAAEFEGEKLAWTIRSPEDEAIARSLGATPIFEGFRPSR